MTSFTATDFKNPVRAIAFYLPQFHPIPENDEWWGKGFTEWTNVAKARPLFPGHYQPHLPADLGFYDLRLPEVREAQAELARRYGIHGFCYYHYWFNGRRILERPFNEVLASGKPDFPFCLCWANENWTRAWDGGERHILLQQYYSHEDDLAHIHSLIPAFHDPRYIRIDGKPLFLVYRTELLPNPAKTAEIWRNAAIEAGLPGLYLARVEGFINNIDPMTIGFDAAVEFAPLGDKKAIKFYRHSFFRFLIRLGLFPDAFQKNYITSYPAVATRMATRPSSSYKRFHCATPMWDNSARREKNAAIFIGSTLTIYEHWLTTIINRTLINYTRDERMVFINAWNEWAEGCHLEPDQKSGKAYLEATRRALQNIQGSQQTNHHNQTSTQYKAVPQHKQLFWRFMNYISQWTQIIKIIYWHIRYNRY